MTQAPITVWNEVRFTSEGISVSLFSESPKGPAVVEDEISYTYDELQKMAPSEPLSLNLSDESKEALSENEPSQESGISDIFLPEVGDIVTDGRPPSWSKDDRLKVVGISDKSADEYVIQESPFGSDETVATANPCCDSDETVVEAVYIDGSNDTYAFPLSRLEIAGRQSDGI